MSWAGACAAVVESLPLVVPRDAVLEGGRATVDACPEFAADAPSAVADSVDRLGEEAAAAAAALAPAAAAPARALVGTLLSGSRPSPVVRAFAAGATSVSRAVAPVPASDVEVAIPG